MSQAGQVRITTIGLVTADRPGPLRRALASFSRHCELHSHQPRFVIVDGSRQPRNRSTNRAAVSELARTTGFDAQYVGPFEARRFRARLPRIEGNARQLAPGTAGANRNLLLLLTSGEYVLMLDDDVLAETWELPDRRNGLIIAGHEDLRRSLWFPDRAAAFRAIAPKPLDLLGGHDAVLGQPLTHLITQSHDLPDFTRACDHVVLKLIEGEAQIVKVTFSGLAGDAAVYCPHLRLLARGASGTPASAIVDEFELSLTSREVLRVAPANLVTHESSCMSYCMGVSNETLLPPFMPMGGNEDGVFGMLIGALDPSALFGHLPIGVRHDSRRPSAYTGPLMRSATESRLSELVISLVRRVVSAGLPSAPEQRMRRIGEALVEVAAMPIVDLEQHVASLTRQRRCREFELAAHDAETLQCSPHWRSAFERYRAEFMEHLHRRDFVLPIEFHGHGSTEDGYRALALALSGFGRLIAAWPELWNASVQLKPGRFDT